MTYIPFMEGADYHCMCILSESFLAPLILCDVLRAGLLKLPNVPQELREWQYWNPNSSVAKGGFRKGKSSAGGVHP